MPLWKVYGAARVGLLELLGQIHGSTGAKWVQAFSCVPVQSLAVVDKKARLGRAAGMELDKEQAR